MGFMAAEEAIGEIRNGRMVLVVDDEDRENEGDLIMAAEKVRPEDINLITKFGRGLLCQAITQETAARLELSPMVRENTSAHATAFTVSVDAREGTTTGISAADRAATILTLASPASRPADLVRPGHIFPLVAAAGGLLERRGHTEAAVELASLAGLAGSGILCEVLDEDGSMARLPALERLASRLGIGIVTIDSLAGYRRLRSMEPRVAPGALQAVSECRLPTDRGEFRLLSFENPGHPDSPHLALVSVRDFDRNRALVRVHSECLTGEVLGSERCDCAAQLAIARERIAREGGAVVYLRQEGRGIGLTEKLKAYTLQDRGLDTVDANTALGHPVDARNYSIAVAILRSIGVSGVRLLSNNPDKAAALETGGIAVRERLSLTVPMNGNNRAYLEAKRARLGHSIEATGITEESCTRK